MSAMRRVVSSVLLVLVLASVAAAADWKAGAAKINITPDKPMWMAGYASRTRPAEGKESDLWAKALILEDGEENRAAVITLDLVGIGRQLSQDICKALEQKHGLERHQIAICTSHTHSGPVVGRNLGPLHYLLVDEEQKKRIEEYADDLQENVVEVVGEALDKLSPSSLEWGSGTTTFAVNRRNNAAAEVPELRTNDQLVGPDDHDVPVLAVRDDDGKLTSVLFGYACHATTMSFYEWSGDYPGAAQAELEANHPDCVALFWAGCGGDQNPLPRRRIELLKHYGKRLATAVDTVLLTTQMTPIEGTLRTSYGEIDLPFDKLPTREEIEEDTESSNKYVAARAKMLLKQIEEQGELEDSYPYPVAVWQLGDMQWVILGGEVVVDYALRLKAELLGEQTWVAGYANDVMAYIPSRRVLREGGYEGGGAMVYYGLPTVWAPTVEKDIVDAVHAQLEETR